MQFGFNIRCPNICYCLTSFCFRSLCQNDSVVETNGEDALESRNALPDVSLVSPTTRFEHSRTHKAQVEKQQHLMSAVITRLNNVTEDLRRERKPGKCLVSNCAML